MQIQTEDILNAIGELETNAVLVNKTGRNLPITLTVNEIWSDSDNLMGFLAIISDNTKQFDLPMDIIKIDGRYIKKILKDQYLKTDMQGMIHSAKVRNIEVVAEFAENKAIVEQLKQLGVDYAQGYYYSKPKPLSDVING